MEVRIRLWPPNPNPHTQRRGDGSGLVQQLGPGDAEAYVNRGRSYFGLVRFGEVIQEYVRAVNTALQLLEPEGIVSEKLKKAVGDLTKAVELDPVSPEARDLLQRCFK